MHSINVLEVPEIVQIIACHLINLEPCLAVCKSWRSLYLPYHWHTVWVVDLKGMYNVWKGLLIVLFDPIRHSHYLEFIRELNVHLNFSAVHFSIDYPNLRSLCLYGPDDKDLILQDFANRHPLLECLVLYNVPHSITDPAWTALVDHPRLNKVILDCSHLVPDDFWRVCARLRTLEFSCSDQQFIPKDLMLPSIRRLKLKKLRNLEFMDQLDVIAACPLLEDLDWTIIDVYFSTRPEWARFARLATKGTWPYLRQLTLYSHANDADVAQVIASMHQATKIDFSGTPFGPLSFAALQRHTSTLQYLAFPRKVDSWIIRDVLCHFSRLEHLKAPRIDAKDIVEGGPWVSTCLTTMTLEIAFRQDQDHLQPAVFERISHLVYLEEFTCWIDEHTRSNDHGLIFRLESGMGALVSLSRLQSLSVDLRVQAVDSDDARWIMDHWKRLTNHSGLLKPR